MRKLSVLALVAFLITALAPVGQTSSVGTLSLVRVKPRSASEAALLMNSFDETHNHGTDHIELLTWPGDLARLQDLGVDYEITVPDVVARDAALADGPIRSVPIPGPDLTDYRRLPDYEREMKELVSKNKSFIKLLTLPEKSLEGRTVYGLELGTKPGVKDGRPIFYMDAVHHAREWPASEFTMIYAHYLAEKFGKDKAVTRLLKKARVILIPVVNVDGFDYSREAPDSQNRTVSNNSDLLGAQNGFEGYWRKNRRSLTGVTVPVAQKNPDAYGVDPNRNYAYEWGDTHGGSSGDRTYATYRGDAPFSEPETRNVRSIVLGRSVTGVITNHTYQNSVLQSGGDKAPDVKTIIAIGQKMADVMGYTNQASVGYPTTGTTDDWAYAAIGSLGFTIEHGRINFHPPYSTGVLEHANNVMKAFTIMAEVSANPKYHSIVSGKVVKGGRPVKATLTFKKSFTTPLSPGNPIGKKSVSESVKVVSGTKGNGSFAQHIGPSKRPFGPASEIYTLVVSAGGKSKTIRVKVRRGQRLNLGTIRL